MTPFANTVSTPPPSDVFSSFWMGGFEGADHVNGHGHPLDMARSTGHADRIEEDHRRAAAMGIGIVRESVGWRLTEPAPGRFDLERVLRIARSANAHGLQVLWTFMHYGTPADLSLYDESLCDRFVRFASTVAEALAPLSARAPVYNLVNEIGFLAWAAAATGLVHPYRGEDHDSGDDCARAGYDIKCRLVRASVQAMHAVRRIDARARFLHIEPIIHAVAPRDRPDLAPMAEQFAGYQWQAWDMIAGRCEPGLGGEPGLLDLVGVNHYHGSQWEVATGERLDWHTRDARRQPFAALLQSAWQRYRRPLIVAETSHFGDGRAAWLHEIASEVSRARRAGVPVEGICLYPLVDRHDWQELGHWHHCGLWDMATTPATPVAPVAPVAPAASTGLPGEAATVAPVFSAGSSPDAPPTLNGAPCADYAAALRQWQAHFSSDPQQQGKPMPCLIVFSHLRWSFVYQRPQHLMSRLARHYRVLFVEEPVRSDGPARLDRIAQGPGLEVLVPHTPIDAPGFHDDQLSVLQTLLAAHLEDEGIEEHLVWFYTPMALPLLALLEPRAVIYDCMDELSAFDHAPRQLRQRETALLKIADLVLTGGPALYEAKRPQHANVHCLPSSVDAAHYAPAGLDHLSEVAREVTMLQGDLPRPRLGFFGVIDERFDVELVAQVAEAHPDWQLVMVGPVVKIDPARLPRHANIHWLGMQPYARLPYLLAGWDLCLMPFAINEATRFISPTKTLEYMAGERPVVSTPVHDVIGLYGDSVRIAPAGPAFIAACEAALAEDRPAREARLTQMLATVHRSSWDSSAETVHGLIAQVLSRPGRVARSEVDAADAHLRSPAAAKQVEAKQVELSASASLPLAARTAGR